MVVETSGVSEEEEGGEEKKKSNMNMEMNMEPNLSWYKALQP